MATDLHDVDAETTGATVDSARRTFLRQAGAYAAVTPPLVATLLAVTSTPALASGSGSSGGRGRGRGGGRGRGRAKAPGRDQAKCKQPWQKDC